MSDFVSRLAARAVGEEPRAQPSAAPGELQASGPEAVPETPVARAAPVAPEVRSEVPEARAEPAKRAAEPVETSERSAGQGQAAESPALDEQVVPAVSPHEPAERAAETSPTETREIATVVAATPVPAARVVSRVFDTQREYVRTVSTATVDEPPVRVHIGRLEVRANLEQQAPPQRKGEPATPEGPSLSDYLRGRRSA